MACVCHLFDASAGWAHRCGAGPLLDRLAADGWTGLLVVPSKVVADRLSVGTHPVTILRHGVSSAVRARRSVVAGLRDVLAVPAARRFLTERQVDLVHAWSVDTAWRARACDRPLVVTLFDPTVAAGEVKRLRALARPRGFAVACTTGHIRRRLIEGGLADDLCVVIRPGVDFALINECRRGPLRSQLGLAHDETAVLVPEPPARDDGATEVLWAATMIRYARGRIRLIVPGSSSQTRRLVRLASTVFGHPPLLCPAAGVPFEQLVAVSNVLAVASRGDVPTTAIAWAFAAGTPVIGSAVHAVAELVSHKVNGLLFKWPKGKRAVRPIMRLLRDRDAQREAAEVARGHAYEVFSLSRYVNQHRRLYENLIEGVSPNDGITDPALTA